MSTLCLRPEPLILETLGVAVLPAPLTQRNTHSDLTEWFVGAETPPGMLRVGVAHGSVEGILADGIDASNPIAPGRARQAALDYLATGRLAWHATNRCPHLLQRHAGKPTASAPMTRAVSCWWN